MGCVWKALNLALAAALIACGSTERTASPPPPAERTLETTSGLAVEASLSGGETHVYRFDLPAGWFADLSVEQLGIDVSVTLEGPDGQSLLAADSLFGPNGAEPAVAVAKTTGPHRLKIHAPGSEKGRYVIRAAAFRPATQRDRIRVATEILFSEGEALRQRGDRPPIEEAIRKETEALGLFRSLGEERRRADVLYSLGYAQISLD